jgi:outer membrane protein assembly complex protein YaeT
MATLGASPESSQSKPHRIRRVLALLGIAMLVVLGGLLVFLHTRPARQYALESVSKLLQQQNIEFNTDQLSYNLLNLELTLRHVRVRSQTAPDLPPFATIDRVNLDLSLSALMQRQYNLQSGEAEGVAIHYVVDGDGRDNLPRPPRDPDQAGKPLDYFIDHLQVRHANVRYENRPQRIDLTLPITSLEVVGDALENRHTVRLEAANGRMRVRDREAALTRLSGAVDIGEDDARVERVELDAEGASVAVSGTVAQFADPHADLAVRGTLDAARASSLAGLADPVTGKVTIDGTVKGPVTAPALAARVEGTGVSFRNLSDLDIATNASYDLTARRATFADLRLQAPFGEIAGNGTVALAERDTSRVSATVSSLDAAEVMRAFALPYSVASRVDAQVQAEWPALDFLRAAGNATINLTPTTAGAARSVTPAGGRLNVMGRVDALDAVLTRVTAAGVELNGRVRVIDQQRLGGDIQMRVSDISRTLATAASVMGRGPLVPVTVSGPVSGTARLDGTIGSPIVAAALRAPSLAIGTAKDLSLAADIRYTQDLVTLRDVNLQWQGAAAKASGTVGLTGSRPLDLALDATALDIRNLLQAADQAQIPASGTLSMAGTIRGTISQPAIAATIDGSELVAYNETLGSLRARISTKDRVLTLADVVVDKPQAGGNGRLDAAGTYHLDRRTYTFDLRSQQLRLLSLSLPNGRDLRGKLQLNARGAGSLDQPAATVNLTADGLRVDAYEIGRLAADAVVASRQARINLTTPEYGVTAKAVIGIDRPYATTANVRIDALDLAKLPLQRQTPLDGQLRATFDATANLDTPEGMQVAGVVESFSGSWNGQPFSIDGPARLRYANERLAIEQLRLLAQDSSVTVRGELPLTDGGAPGAITVEARANLATLARYAPAGTALTGAGDVTMSGVIRGTLRAIDPDVNIVVSNAALHTPQLAPGVSSLQARVQIAAGEATIERLSAAWGTATITATGRVPLEAMPQLPVDLPRRGGPATFSARIEGLDLMQVPGAPEGLTGRVSLEAQLTASRAELNALDGRILFPELQLAFNGLTLAQESPSTIRLANGVAAIEQFTVTGSTGTIAASGSIGLGGDRPLNVDAQGNLNLAALAFFTDAVRAEGETALNIAARGTLAAPDLTGFVDLRNAQLIVDEPTIAVGDLNARLVLAGRRISVASLTGSINGGDLTGSGRVELGANGIEDLALDVAAEDVAFDAPLDLRSMFDAKLRFRRREDEYLLDGQVTLEEAGLTGDINFDEGLFAAMQSRRTLDLTSDRNPFLERVRFDVNVDTATPILVDNNLARAEVTADLRVVGSPYEPGLVGRLAVLEQSEITLNERRYEVERGDITFLAERRILPSFDLLLHTSVRNYDINVAVSGTPGDTETSLTSNPTLPETDIMAILATGRTLEEMRGEEFEVARAQVLSYLAGRLGSQLGRGLRDATGFDTVRIEPQLIANETDPSARLTVGEEIADDLEFVYSVDLTDSNDQIWLAEYDVTRRFQTSAVRQSDNSYRMDFRHDMRFGGTPEPARVERRRPIVNRLTVVGDGKLPEAELRDRLKVEQGKEFDFFRARDGVDKIEAILEERGYLQSRVRLQRQETDLGIDVTLTVTAGPQVTLVFEGATPPGKVVEDIRTKWRRGVFDTQRLDDTTGTLRGWLMKDNYLQAEVAGNVEEVSPGERRVRITIEPGPRIARVVLAFEGAQGVSPDTLDDIVNEQNLELELFTDPQQVTTLLERYYREVGYLTAAIEEPRYEFTGSQARVVLSVKEGSRFFVREVTASGTRAIPAAALLADLPVQAGDPYLPFAAENALQHVRDLYWRRGYNDVRTDYALVLDRAAGRVDVRFEVVEGAQSVVADIQVQGNDHTTDRLVREQLELQPEEPLDLNALARSRRNLYDTQAFSIVDITREELVASASPSGADSAQSATPAEKPVRLNVAVREQQPFQLRYGASYDTERGVGGVLDVSNHNMLGKARVLGFRSRYDSQITDLRAYVSQPSLRYWPIATIFSIYYTDERNPPTELTRRYDVDRRGVSINQERELGDHYLLNWGFRYERARSFDPEPGSRFDELFTVTPLTTTLTRETRDDVLDATRGAFMSQGFSYAPTWLGGDRAYIKYFGQYFHYFPLQPERRKRFTNEILRPRFVYAAGVRVGLARSIENVLPVSERFFAGGGTTIRGFEQNSLGPVGFDGLPQGGGAMLVINNELRFPLIRIFDGVVFGDIGNVFPTVADFSLSDLRESAGVGLRARTRWFLLRGDYGILLDPRAGERRARFYFSIGQAF